jgi:hypothetical protein
MTGNAEAAIPIPSGRFDPNFGKRDGLIRFGYAAVQGMRSRKHDGE